jgi:hypothetical protein
LSVEVSSFCWWPTMAGRGCVFTGILLPAAVHSERSSNGEGLSVALYARHLVLMWHAVAMFHSCCLSMASIFNFFFFHLLSRLLFPPNPFSFLFILISLSSFVLSSHIQNSFETPISLPLSNPMFSASLSSRHLPFFPVFVNPPFSCMLHLDARDSVSGGVVIGKVGGESGSSLESQWLAGWCLFADTAGY